MKEDRLLGKQLQDIPKPGEFYQHFKGNLYQILTIAIHTETEEPLVIYQALYGEFKVFAQPLTVFQKITEDGTNRFVKVDMGSHMIEQTSCSNNTLTKYSQKNREKGIENRSEIVNKADDVMDKGDTISESLAKEKELYDLMEKFYDADSYEEKLDYLLSMRGQLNDIMLSNIAISLDIVAQDGTLEERFQSIVSCLKTMEKYQGRRLR